MIDAQTVKAAQEWCATGVSWIDKNAVNLGLGYLDKAIPVFQEAGDLRWSTYARHNRLEGLRRRGQHEQVEAQWDEVMHGYAQLGDTYGQALLLLHVADAIAALGRPERAAAYLNLAEEVARAGGHQDLLCHVVTRAAHLFEALGNAALAVRLFQQAEHEADRADEAVDIEGLRFGRALALIQLGENGEAQGLLEDVQARYRRQERYREAVAALDPLARIYEQEGLWDDRNRIKQLTQLCGQHIVHEQAHRLEDMRREPRLPAPGAGSLPEGSGGPQRTWVPEGGGPTG